jgi:hypothetical protein
MTSLFAHIVLFAVLALPASAAIARAPVALPFANPPAAAAVVTLQDGIPQRSGERPTGQATPLRPTGDGTDVVLGATTNNETVSESGRTAVALPGGGFAVSWEDCSFPDVATRLQIIDASGAPLLANGGQVVDRYYGGNFGQGYQTMAAHPTSGVIIVVTHSLSDTSSEIRVHSIAADGSPRWAAAGVPAFGGAVPNRVFREPTVIAAADGGAFVCAYRNGSGPDFPVVCQRIGSDGTVLWASDGVLAGGRPGWRFLPRPLHDGAGGIVVFWQNNGIFGASPPNLMHIAGQRFSPTGARLWGEDGMLVYEAATVPINAHVQHEFDAVSDGAGGAVVAFEDWNGVGVPSRDVFAQRVAVDGTILWSDAIAVETGPLIQQLDSLTSTADGGVVVAVQEFEPDAIFRSRIHRLDGDGAQLWDPAGLPLGDPANPTEDYSSRGVSDGDRVRFAWTHQQTLFTYTFDVHYAEYTLAGERITPVGGTPLRTGAPAQFLRAFAHDTTNRTSLAVFEDYFPESQGYDASGALLGSDAIFAHGFEPVGVPGKAASRR